MRISILSLVLAGIVFSAERVSTPIDNDQVRVLDVIVQPGEKTRLHEHKINRVMIYLDEGSQHFEYQGKGPSDLKWKAGQALWSPAAGMHVAEITSSKPVRIIEVELKKPKGGLQASGPLDPVKIDPKHYHVEFENDQVRVVRVKIGPGETVPKHEHKLNRVAVYLTDQDFRVTNADGKVETPHHKAGEVGFSGPTTHSELNQGKKPFEIVVIELKG
jgi:quercetin dioxygenase-like cupin family protein